MQCICYLRTARAVPAPLQAPYGERVDACAADDAGKIWGTFSLRPIKLEGHRMLLGELETCRQVARHPFQSALNCAVACRENLG